MKKAKLKNIILASCCLIILALALSSMGEIPLLDGHPAEVDNPVCSECHTDKAWLDHTPDWDASHRFAASREERLCSLCHKPSFCSDCHALQEEIKPSDKHKDSPARFLEHRGDYLTQHKIDGKINPVPCFRCHGRQNNKECRTCHK